MLAYILITMAEVFISITCLEFSYTQAPKKMKSFILALFLMSVSIGNLFTALVNRFIGNEDGTSKLAGADYYLFFSAVMLVSAIKTYGSGKASVGHASRQAVQVPQWSV